MEQTGIDGIKWATWKCNIDLISITYGKSVLISRASVLVLFGLQNQCTGDELVGGFDSHALPPLNKISCF
jgi:hypothetical protein